MNGLTTIKVSNRHRSLAFRRGARLLLAENIVSLSKITDQGTDSDSPALPPLSVMVNSQAADPETERWELIKGTTEASDLSDFLDLFPSGKLPPWPSSG